MIARAAALEIERQVAGRRAPELAEPHVIVEVVDGAMLEGDGPAAPSAEEPCRARALVSRPVAPPEPNDLVLRRDLE